MKTILIPTDFSPSSDKAVEFGIEIAKKTGAKILLANSFFIPVLDINVPPNMMEAMYEAEEKSSESRLRTIAKKIRDEKDINRHSLNCDFISEQNLPGSEIVTLADKKNVDLIIMGTKGKESFLGLWRSITAETASKIHCPLLIVKENTPLTYFNKIDFAIENIKEENLSIKELVKFAKIFHSEINLIHVEKHAKSAEDIQRINEISEDTRSFISSIREYCDYSKINYTTVLSDDTAEGLLKFLKGTKADLLAVLKYHRNWIENIFHKSVIKELIGEKETPILIIPKREKIS